MFVRQHFCDVRSTVQGLFSVIAKSPEAILRRIWRAEDSERCLGPVLSRQSYAGIFMVQERYLIVGPDKVKTVLGILRMLVMEKKTVFSIKLWVKRDIVIACGC